MLKRPTFRWAAVAIMLAAWAGVVARGADDTPESVPKAAEEARKSAAEALKSPESVLSARGLTRSIAPARRPRSDCC